MTDLSTRAATRASFGSIALLTAFLIVLLQTVGSGDGLLPGLLAGLLAVLLAILGVGLRIEAAVLGRSDQAPEPAEDRLRSSSGRADAR